VQGWFIGRILSPLYREWLRMALAMGAIAMENGSTLPATKYDKFAAHTWQGRRWPWVDPEKDINAAILAIGARLDSPQRIAAQQGRDIEDVLDDIAAFETMAAAKNVSLFAAPPAAAHPQINPKPPT
jgi:capsid protein